MSSLDKSLDAIIAADKTVKQRKARQQKSKTAKTAGKPRTAKAKKAAAAAIAAAVVRKAAKNRRAKNGAAPGGVLSKLVDKTSVDSATKVIVSGLPTDIKPESIREFFQSQVGGVRSVSLSYNERGHSLGIATVRFGKGETARKAVAKYNNAPIDGKKRTLKLELVVDPTVKSLASRITPNPLPVGPAKKGALQQKLKGKKAKKAAAAAVVAAAAAKKVKKTKQKKVVKKKTVAELDQEMADYFAKGEEAAAQQ